MFASRLLVARRSSSALAGARLRTPLVPARRFVATPMRRAAEPPHPSEAFLQGNAANYVEEMYAAWKADTASVHKSWDVYFRNVDRGAAPGAAFVPPPTLGASGASLVPASASASSAPAGEFRKPSNQDILDHLKVQLLVRAYQVRGHHLANLDPLGILDPDLATEHPPELDLSFYGLSEADLDRSFFLGQGVLPKFVNQQTYSLTLREIIEKLKMVYCGNIGFEYMHIPSKVQCDWIRSHIEGAVKYSYGKEQKRVILDRLLWADSFERFVASKYASEKRFGLEGCESLIPGMKALIDASVDYGVEAIVMGMPHRGRLNVLSNVVRKPNESIFCEFSGTLAPSLEGSGDVKYHLGMNYDRPTPSGKRVHLSLVANPSHLEAVDPVVEGKVRGLQFFGNDESRSKVLAVLLHGDAAFAGQGVVYETLGFADLPSYTTGGTIHIIVNNQIGFTTDPRFARSTPYCTDVAKSINAPIFHVNGDDVESVVYVCELAANWRRTFKKDVVIDIVCYRKHGHNEVDQPSFTQPRMYQVISKKKPISEVYIEKLLAENSLNKEEIEEMKKTIWQKLEESYVKSKDYVPSSREWMSSAWEGFLSPRELAQKIATAHPTGVPLETLKMIGSKVSSYPPNFHVHPGLNRVLKARMATIESEKDVDMATAEAMAFGSLLVEGHHVRLSGQDVERGTFSQRHAVLHDQQDEHTYTALNDLDKTQAHFSISNSSLSEFGIVGFELGYSMVSPHALVCWEAQFGDFANTAQPIIDQFICSGEKKWLQRTGLVMLLPHGYDGAGPEHSSCRLERFLQQADESPHEFPETERQHQDCNIQVAYCSTPANYFHILRRQIHRDFRKPLIIATSKSLLRDPRARSALSEMTTGTRFQRLIPDTGAQGSVSKVIFCSGQVYYLLEKARADLGRFDVAIARVEEINPFPFDLVVKEVDRFETAKEIVWVQEEPMNMGCWTHAEPRIETALKHSKHHAGKRVSYVGREPSAAVATGNKKQHVKEEAEIVKNAFGL